MRQIGYALLETSKCVIAISMYIPAPYISILPFSCQQVHPKGWQQAQITLLPLACKTATVLLIRALSWLQHTHTQML